MIGVCLQRPWFRQSRSKNGQYRGVKFRSLGRVALRRALPVKLARVKARRPQGRLFGAGVTMAVSGLAFAIHLEVTGLASIGTMVSGAGGL